jgi:hypothetical protein
MGVSCRDFWSSEIGLSQIFSILSDLKCYRSGFSSFTNHL